VGCWPLGFEEVLVGSTSVSSEEEVSTSMGIFFLVRDAFGGPCVGGAAPEEVQGVG
jgi:hypothetical protein